jgi:hypothetical protein
VVEIGQKKERGRGEERIWLKSGSYCHVVSTLAKLATKTI